MSHEQPELPLEFSDDDGSTYARVDPGEFDPGSEDPEADEVEIDPAGDEDDDEDEED